MRFSGATPRAALGALVALLACCDRTGCKTPLSQVNAGFDVSDAAWFEEEETLFFFWSAFADQGIGPESVVEVTYTTDDVTLPWTDVTTLPTVHPHVVVDCGPGKRCGSSSLHVAKPPRGVGLRLRYARGGELTLDPVTVYNAVGRGDPWSARSALVYGVFDEPNERVQWRLRHTFPTIHNEQATQLGLRRHFTVEAETHGALVNAPPAENPYGYGMVLGCPAGFQALSAPQAETTDRATFDAQVLPQSASASPHLCAQATVDDATGPFVASAIARKNPQVKPAFPSLRSPIQEDLQVRFVLQPCQRTISAEHLAMQKQRLRIEPTDDVICLDAFADADLEDGVVARISSRIDARRAQGQDMMVVLVLHHDDETGQVARHVEAALTRVLTPEVTKSTPRAVGAFVLDSYGHRFTTPALAQHVLWCPGLKDATGSASTTSSCALQLGFGDLKLGPLTVGLPLPILPTRQQYLDFIATYSTAQAGEMSKVSFRSPERTTVSTDRPLGTYGVATFFNGEAISAVPYDVFSYCALDPVPPVVFTAIPGGEVLPLSALPQVQQAFPQPSYQLGLAWAFPWLVQLEYVSVVAGKLTAYTLGVPFGIASDAEAFVGSEQWKQASQPMADALAQCTRFCEEPTFDSDGIYQVLRPFRSTYEALCYRPVFPKAGDGGFPSDP